MKRFRIGLIALALVAKGLCSEALAADRAKAKEPPPAYGQDLISVVTEQHASVPTGTCVVWANAEGLGVGPAQLGAYHGVSMNIDLRPLAKDGPPTPFSAGVAAMRRQFPTVPDWMVKALEKNRAAIEKACVEDHETPVTIARLTAADKND